MWFGFDVSGETSRMPGQQDVTFKQPAKIFSNLIKGLWPSQKIAK